MLNIHTNRGTRQLTTNKEARNGEQRLQTSHKNHTHTAKAQHLVTNNNFDFYYVKIETTYNIHEKIFTCRSNIFAEAIYCPSWLELIVSTGHLEKVDEDSKIPAK